VNTLKMLGLALAGLTIGLVGAGQLGMLSGSAPPGLGVTGGRLRPPSPTPNSVSSQAVLYPEHPQRAYATMEPLRFSGDATVALQRLTDVLRNLDGTVIVEQKPDYLHAESSTWLLKFKDDLEFWLDAPAGVIHFRSASRLGRKDFGVNRARMETIRARFQP